MSSPDETYGLADPVRPRLLARWVGLAALPLVELVALTWAFDMVELVRRGGGWGRWVGYSHHLAVILAAAAAATLLLGGRRLVGELRRVEGRPGGGLFPAYLVGHLAALALFAGLTSRIIAGGLPAGAHPGAWVFAWGAAGAAALAFWVLLLLPAPDLPGAAGRLAGLLAAGAGVGFAAWASGQSARQLWHPLSRATLGVSYRMLALVCPDAFCRPDEAVLGAAGYAVEVAPQCSGYEGVGLMWVFLGVYFWAFRGSLRFPRVFLLLPLTTAVMWLANAARIAALVFVGSRVSREVAMGGFHSQAGWLALNAVGLGVVAATRGLRYFAAGGAPAEGPGAREASPYLVPLFVVIAGSMVTGALTGGGFDAYYPLRTSAAGVALWFYRRDYLAGRWGWSGSAVAVAAGALVFAVWMALEPRAPEVGAGAASALAGGLAGLSTAGAVTWLAFRVVGSVLVVPAAEELAFRGFLTRRLIAADFGAVPPGRFTWVSFASSSALFGLMHSRWIAGALAGMLYAAVYYRRGRLGDAFLAHATTNAMIAAYVLTTSSWSLWS